jgi:hypothetical protein
VSVDYKKTVTPAKTWEECYGNGAYYYGSYGKWFDYENGACVSISKALRLSSIKNDKATLLDTLALDADGSWMQQVTFAKDRLFGMTYSVDAATGVNTQRIVSIAGFNAGKFQPGELLLETGKAWYYGSYGIVGVSGESAVLMSWSNENTLFTLDPNAEGNGKLTERGSLRSWASEVRVVGDKAFASLQDRGVQVVSLKLSRSFGENGSGERRPRAPGVPCPMGCTARAHAALAHRRGERPVLSRGGNGEG